MKLIDIAKELKENYNFDIVVIQAGFYFNIFNEDAEYFQEKYDFKVYEQGNNLLTGFPVNRADYWEEKFILQGLEYAFVEQEPKDMLGQKSIIRSVTRSSVSGAIDTQYMKTKNTTRTQRLKESLIGLINGYNPLTGEIFDDNSPWKDPDVTDLLDDIINS